MYHTMQGIPTHVANLLLSHLDLQIGMNPPNLIPSPLQLFIKDVLSSI